MFYTQPTPVYGSGNSFTTSSTPTSQQICDIVSSCPRVAISSSSTFAPQYTSSPYTEQYTSSSTYATSTSFPQYDQPYSSSTVVYNNPTYASGYVPNSNYQFLNGSLQQQYRDHGSTYLSPSNGPLYDQPNQENPPVLTNAEQNEVANFSLLFPRYSIGPQWLSMRSPGDSGPDMTT
ncbi:unnamed protein product [Toxocara canis]|uniref:Eyes absent homolog n=1 Tax=Toxocara canis TaxID=6265 RepID=A0A183UQF9_TOXCA|nr:unnamed protein product [Toxocara canis]